MELIIKSQGGAVNYLCLPDNPEYSVAALSKSVSKNSLVHGTQYEVSVADLFHVTENDGHNVHSARPREGRP